MKKFLSVLGQVVATGVRLFTGFAPIAATVYPGTGNTIAEVTDDLTKVSAIIQSVEAAAASLTDATLTGPQKLQMATSQVAQVVLQSEIMYDHFTHKQAEIQDPELFKKSCADLASAVVGILNSRKPPQQ